MGRSIHPENRWRCRSSFAPTDRLAAHSLCGRRQVSSDKLATKVILVQHLYVAERLQKADVTRRLIRHVVERGNYLVREESKDFRVRGILLKKEDWVGDDTEPFLESGFAEMVGTGYIGYEIKHF
jgi:hypothetical protein